MAERQLEGLMSVTLEKIKEMTGSNTIIGEPIVVDGATILPVSKVTFGYASGGSDLPASQKELFGGGTGGGVSITPIAFLVIQNGNVKVLPVQPYQGAADRVVGMVPDVLDKVSGLVSSRSKKASEENAPEGASAPESAPETGMDADACGG